MARNAQLGQSFTWIFVLIAGGAFLLLFYQVAAAQTEDTQRQRQVEAVDDFTDLIDTLVTSPNTNRTLPGFDRDYQVTCQDNTTALTLPDTPSARGLSDHPVYAPPNLPSRPVNAVTVTYEAPMPVAPVVFLIPTNTEINTSLPRLTAPPQLQPYLRNAAEQESQAHGPVNKIGERLTNDELARCAQAQIYSQAELAYTSLHDKAKALNTSQPERCTFAYETAMRSLDNLATLAHPATANTTRFTANITKLDNANDGLESNSCEQLY